MNNSREYTCKLLDMIDEGLLNPTNVVSMCLSYMSEHDVYDMMDTNELTERFEEEE